MTEVIYDPLSPTVLENPFPVYQKLRDDHPIFWHEGMRSWVVSRYSDCRSILADNEQFARDPRRAGIDLDDANVNIQTIDPPDLNDFKAAFLRALSDQNLDELGRESHRIIEARLKELYSRESFDWITEVAAPVALSMASHLYGVPEPDLRLYIPLSDKIAKRMDTRLKPDRAQLEIEAREGRRQLVDGWWSTITSPGLFNDLRAIADSGEFEHHYARNTIGVVFNAVYGTLFAALSNIVLMLVKDPSIVRDVQEDSKSLSIAVDELLRLEGPAQGTTRYATKDTVLHGQRIKRGDAVVTLMAAANRDPDQFENPDELRLDRYPNRHLAFGWGPHSCLGIAFGRIAVKELVLCLKSAPQLYLAGDPIRRETATVRSLDELPLTFIDKP